MRSLLLALPVLVLAWVSQPVEAHKPSDSYLTLKVAGRTVEGQWDIALRDLDYAIGVDGNDDGVITWGELRTRHETIAAYALSRLQVKTNKVDCPTHPLDHLVDRHSDGTYEVLQFAIDCPRPIESLEIRYNLFFDLDHQHRGLLHAEHQGAVHSAIFSPERSVQRIELGAVHRWRQFLDYLREGIWHIWIGFDHILFLITLLLPAVLAYRDHQWQSIDGLKPAVIDTLKIVTAFTIAHSVTLSLAVMGFVDVPSRWVESAIAASVAVTALNNIRPIFTASRALLAFGFGLVHGLGFASVLLDLGLPSGALVVPLVGFNLGVEAGQLAIVLFLFPIAYSMRHASFYRLGVMQGGSLVATAIAMVWFTERAFDLELFRF